MEALVGGWFQGRQAPPERERPETGPSRSNLLNSCLRMLDQISAEPGSAREVSRRSSRGVRAARQVDWEA
eukprot:8408582-Alexandrium_andersonii.AAC.1